MPTCLCITILAAGIAAIPAEVEREGVRISTSIQAQIYTWEVTNLSAAPITGFEVEQHGCYNQQAPDGWIVEVEGVRFRAWTADDGKAIRRNRSGIFTTRVGSSGAVLGTVRASVETGPAGSGPITFPQVWGPVPKPRGLVALVPLVLAGIVGVHALVLELRRRRATRAP